MLALWNGMGDFAAAIRADRVFAIRGSTLDKYCEHEEIAHGSIDDFAISESGILRGAD